METLISCRDLTKRYGETCALDGFSAEIPRATVGLLGENGAGKTTLIKILMGILGRDGGEVEVFGRKVEEVWPDYLRDLGYMPEGVCSIVGHTPVSYLTYLAQLSGLRYREALGRAHEVLYYVGVYQERYRLMASLSYGVQQRVNIAQALVHGPRLVFLDEPTVGLDGEGREGFLRLIGRLSELGVGVVFSSHILEDIERTCEYIIFLHRGRRVYQGELSKLREGSGRRYRLKFVGDMGRYCGVLEGEGVEVLERERDYFLRVSLPEGVSVNLLLEKALEVGGVVCHLEAIRPSLLEIFVSMTSSG
ncbi:MAG: ABC transporter ATP-binding protein [Planctomycetota bacterium]|nr:MAG: ABC transporter ATP-binding protein [Planctomycetota bacterium]